MKSPSLGNSFSDELLFSQSPTPGYSIANPFKIRHNYSQIEDILNKPYGQRNHKQFMILSKFVNKNEWFSQISQQFGAQIAKGLLRNAKIQQVKANMLISEIQESLQGVVVVLQGKLGLYKHQNIQTAIDIPKNQVFERIIQTVRLQNKEKKKNKPKEQKKSLLRKSSFNTQFKYRSKVRQLSSQQKDQIGILEQEILKDQSYGLKQRIKSKVHLNNVITLQKSIILFMPIEEVFNWLNYSFEQKLMQSFSLIRQIQCFQIFDDEQIQAIIQCMTLRKKSKGDSIFKQNQQIKFIYFLSQGQAKIMKQANLFVDNPNTLYFNRQNLLQQFQIEAKQKVLPYASLSTLYNYRPTKKNIELSVISPFCMFGEQEIYLSKHQTSVIVSSLNAFYYELSLTKFMNFLSSKYWLFQKQVLKFCRQKILRRQQIFSQALNLQNKLHLDYFYVDQGYKPKQIPKKYRLQKLNKKLNPTYSKSKSKFNVQTNNQDSLRTEQNQSFDNQVSYQVPSIYTVSQTKTKKTSLPNITTFNFHRTLLYPKMQPVDLSIYSAKKKFSSPKTTRTQQKANPQNEQMSIVQGALFGNSHTWSIQRQIVKRQKDLLKLISPKRQKISFSKPLFDQKQLKQHQDRSLQIEKTRRKLLLKGYGEVANKQKRIL